MGGYKQPTLCVQVHLPTDFCSWKLAGGLLTGKHRFEDRESSTIQHGRYAGIGSWTDVYVVLSSGNLLHATF